MYTIRATQKVLKRLGARTPAAQHSSTTALGDWYCNIVRLGARQLALCTSDRSLLCVVLPARGLKSQIGEHLPQGLAAVLAALDVAPAAIARELKEMEQCVVAATENRSVLGSMKDFALAIDCLLYAREDLPLLDLALELAATRCGPLHYDHPADVARRMLERPN